MEFMLIERLFWMWGYCLPAGLINVTSFRGWNTDWTITCYMIYFGKLFCFFHTFLMIKIHVYFVL